MVNINKKEVAEKLAKDAGIPLGKNYFTLSSSQVTRLGEIAKIVGYSYRSSVGKGKARSFYEYLSR